MSKRKKMSEKTAWIIVISIVALIIIAIIGGVVYKQYQKDHAGENVPTSESPASDEEPPFKSGEDVFEASHYEFTNDSKINKPGLFNEIKNRDESMMTYQLIIREEGAEGTLEINYWTEDEKGYYEYIFDGYDAGTGLSGKYYRTTIDGLPTIVDYQTGEHHTRGEFFDRYFSLLSELTHDKILEDIFSVTYTQAGDNQNGGVVLSDGNGVSICVYSGKDTKDTYIIDRRGDVAVGYYIAYGQSYSMPIIEPPENR